jgi:uncharacterized protein YoxC
MSSSKLLEQAIVDAQALRDAAFKSAQETLLEKYAPQIKEAVQQLLEQEEETPDADTASPTDALAGGQSDMPLTDFGGSAETSMGKGKVAGTANELPLAATDGEKLCPCPDDDKEVEVELDLGALADQLSDEAEEEEAPGLESGPATGMMGSPQAAGGATALQEDIEEVAGDKMMSLGEEELLEVSLDELLTTEEQLEEDEVEEAKDGVPETEREKELAAMAPPKNKITRGDVVAAKIASGKKEESLSESKAKQLLTASTELLKEHKSLLKSVESKDEKIKQLLDENKKFASTIEEMSQAFKKLEEVNLTNARLFYSNQVLKSASLNERQKNHIVDAVSKADSVNEAKTVYETLVNSVGAPLDKERSPKSLNEAISKKSSFRLPHKQAEQPADPNKDRWLKLAGIK